MNNIKNKEFHFKLEKYFVQTTEAQLINAMKTELNDVMTTMEHAKQDYLKNKVFPLLFFSFVSKNENTSSSF
jgi:hypothetical protein